MFNKLLNYLKASQEELKKVVWPSKKETRNHTLLVIGISLLVAIFLGAIDFLFNFVLDKLIR